MRRVVSSWKVIEAVLREHAHSVFEALRPPATDGQIGALEAAIGRKLPPDLAASLRIHDGTDAGAVHGVRFVDVYGLLSTESIAAEYATSRWASGQTERYDRALSPSGAIRTDIRWRAGWIPVLINAGGGLIHIDLEPGPEGSRGQVVEFGNWTGPDDVPLAPSWRAWLDAHATRLERRAFVLDPFGEIVVAPRLIEQELARLRGRIGLDAPADRE